MRLDKTITFPEERVPERTDRYLAESLPDISRSQIKNLIESGAVLRNNKPVKPSAKAWPGDVFTIVLPEPVELKIQPENIPLNIIYEDEDLAMINKQAGMIAHPAGKILSGTLVNALLYHLTGLSGINGVLRPGIVHRLDKDTTGIMLVAKNDLSHRRIAEQFESRTIQKKYAALVWGIFENNEGYIKKSISRSRSDRTKMISGYKGRKSLTEYTVKKEYEFLSLVEARPKTGRTHQIRSHFASIGHPVFGDSLYRGRNRRLATLTKRDRDHTVQMLKQFPRQALHAESISFTHPSTNEPLTFSAPLPEDFKRILGMIENAR